MFSKLKRIILTAAACGMLLTPALVPAAVGAQDVPGSICQGAGVKPVPTECPTQKANDEISNLMKNIINFLSLLVGFVSVVMIIIGGFQYVVSNGDTGKIATAKNTIIFALVGLIVVAMAQFIVHFVLGHVAGF